MWLKTILRRFLVPAFVGGYMANIAIYQMLESEGAATDWQSIFVLFAIVLSGLIVAWPILFLLRRQSLPAPILALFLLGLGIALGTLFAYLIALQIVPDTASDYIYFGLLVGPVATILWLIINLDVLRRPYSQQSGD